MRVSKEEAALKAKQCGNNIEFIEWNGPSNPAKARCLDCGRIFEYEVGGKYIVKNQMEEPLKVVHVNI